MVAAIVVRIILLQQHIPLILKIPTIVKDKADTIAIDEMSQHISCATNACHPKATF